MPNFLVSREAVKVAAQIQGSDRDARIDRIIEGISDEVEKACRAYFIPRTETRLFRWPNQHGIGTRLWTNTGLISVATLQSKAQDSSPTTISSDDYFLEPQEFGPPYNRIEIDLSSNAAFEPGNTPQRSISVAGEWGHSANTKAAGTIDGSGINDTTSTSFVCSNASLIDVGDTLLIESEKLFVSERAFANITGILINDAAFTASMADVTLTVDASHGIQAGEIIMLDSEQLYVVSVATNDLTVIRAYNGSVLASHADDTQVQINRTLTVTRGENGSTAAAHADTTAISKYVPEPAIANLVLDASLAKWHQEQAGWGPDIGKSGAAAPFTGMDLTNRAKRIIHQHQWLRSEAI